MVGDVFFEEFLLQLLCSSARVIRKNQRCMLTKGQQTAAADAAAAAVAAAAAAVAFAVNAAAAASGISC